MATASQVERSWRARKSWQSRWRNKLEQLKRLKAMWGDEWVRKHRSKSFVPDLNETELRQKWLEQKARNRRWLYKKREKFNETLPEASEI